MDTKKIYTIFVKYFTGEIEKLDEVEDYNEAKSLVARYKMAFTEQNIDILLR